MYGAPPGHAQGGQVTRRWQHYLGTALSRRGPEALPYAEDVKLTVRQQLLDLVLEFPSLDIRAARYTYNDGHEMNLLKISGTVPMFYRGQKYNLPVAVWLPEYFPRSAPICYLNPTADMMIKPNHRNVNPSGLVVNEPYLQQWSFPSSNLLELAHTLSITFGQDPPLFSKPPGWQAGDEQLGGDGRAGSGSGSGAGAGSGAGSGAGAAGGSGATAATGAGAGLVMGVTSGLHQHAHAAAHATPQHQQPQHHVQHQNQPQNQHQHQDQHHQHHQQSQQQQQHGHYPAPDYGHHSQQQGGAVGYVQHQQPVGGYPPQGGVTSPDISSSYHYDVHASHHTQQQQQQHQQQVQQPLPHGMASQQQFQQPLAQPSRPNPINTFKKRASEALEERLKRSAAQAREVAEGRRQDLEQARANLDANRAHLDSDVAALTQERDKLENDMSLKTKKGNELEEWLSRNDRNLGEVDIDEAFEASSSLSAQALEAMSTDLAIEDILYDLEQGLRNGVIESESYFRQVRLLARRQFFSRALSMKIAQVQLQAGVVAGRPARPVQDATAAVPRPRADSEGDWQLVQ